MIGLVLLYKQVVESLSLYETSILDVDLCVECARGFRYLDDLCCTVFNRRYAYDKAGNLIQSADQRGGVLNYVYDKARRLTILNNENGEKPTVSITTRLPAATPAGVV